MNHQCIYDVSHFPKITVCSEYVNEISKEARTITKFSAMRRPSGVWVDDEGSQTMKDFMKLAIKNNDEWIMAWDEGGEWWNYPIMLNDEIVEGKTKELCPVTVSLLEKMKGIKIAGYSRLNKGGVIQKHRDSNGQLKALTYHLGLVGKSYLIADGVRLDQYPGAQFIFDSEFEHSARNDNAEDRIVLYILFDKKHHMTI